MVKIRYAAIRYVCGAALKLMCVAAVLALGFSQAIADDSHLAYLPMTFHAEGQDIRTTACLQVTEHVYSESNWWEGATGNASAPERAFKGVMAAIQHSDRDGLLRLSDPQEAKDPKHFDEQASAFFQQFRNLEVVGVPLAYDFDGLAVFFPKLRSQRRIFFAPFIFASETDGSFGFLPRRTRQVTYQLVNDWVQATWGPTGNAHPTYCTDDDIKRATHRVSLVSSSKEAWHPSQLFLRGASFDAPGELGDLVASTRSAIEGMKAAFAKGIDEFVKHLTPEGGSYLKQWFISAESKEREQYWAAIADQKPFFLFDLSSVVVVYTRPPMGQVQVMYFTFGAKHELLWTNASHVTVMDTVFKAGPLYDAASSKERPFSSVAK